MFDNFYLREIAKEGLNKISNDRKSASDLGLDHCNQCGTCCWRRPCSLVKKDIPTIAKYLNITEKELFNKYLVVDEITWSSLVILPRRHSQEDLAGKYVPSNRTYDMDTPCVFFDDEKRICAIHNVKPTGGRSYGCYSKNNEHQDYSWDEEDVIKLGWNGDKYWDDYDDNCKYY